MVIIDKTEPDINSAFTLTLANIAGTDKLPKVQEKDIILIDSNLGYVRAVTYNANDIVCTILPFADKVTGDTYSKAKLGNCVSIINPAKRNR